MVLAAYLLGVQYYEDRSMALPDETLNRGLVIYNEHDKESDGSVDIDQDIVPGFTYIRLLSYKAYIIEKDVEPQYNA